MTSRARPEPGNPREYFFPDFEVRDLANGIRLYLCRKPELPIVTLKATVNAGASADPAGKEGLAELTAALLTEGTLQYDGVQLTEELEMIGAALDSAADWDHAAAELTVMKERLPRALQLLADVLVRPSFPERELLRLREERLAALMQIRSDPGSLADLMFTSQAYSPDSRYSRPAGGNEASVAALQRQDVLEFHASRYSPRTAALVLVGDIDLDAVTIAVENIFGDWEDDRIRVPIPQVNDTAAPADGRYCLVEKPDAQQSEIRIGHRGVPRSHPDYFRIVVLNAILGGLFSSRINLNLREKHGYTYGAFSSFDWRRGAGPFLVSAAVRNDATGPAIREVLAEIERIRTGDVSDAELSLATSYMIGVFPIRFETTAAIAGALTSMEVYSLAEDYFDIYRDAVAAVTPAQLREVAIAELLVDRLHTVVVGDPAEIAPQMEEISGRPLRRLDPSGTEL